MKIENMASSQLHNLVTACPSKNILIKQITYTQHVIPITGTIGDIDEYGELTQILANATAKDEIYIQLSSSGGSLETCDYLCRRMDECTAHIVVEIGLTCVGVACAIPFHADDWVIRDSSTMIISPLSYSPGYGKESDVREHAKYMKNVHEKWVERTFEGVLSEDEKYDLLENGKHLDFFADDLHSCLDAYQEHRNKSKLNNYPIHISSDTTK
ncbi:ATP-dependent Clp protease proteolytic subunit [Pseudomonas putida]|uniref:ATP-dependent Clp protease proteolytic subunit n=1 Tax=Pseudomonas putida TaxID=303 RepID=UPI000A403345|nr:ATP-dependent Clp protease proteolytic subunit [Pseudomonas putida]